MWLVGKKKYTAAIEEIIKVKTNDAIKNLFPLRLLF